MYHNYHLLSGGNEEVLNQVDLPILDDQTCQMHWQDYIPDTELCAGYENMHKDFCAVRAYVNIFSTVTDNSWFRYTYYVFTAPPH